MELFEVGQSQEVFHIQSQKINLLINDLKHRKEIWLVTIEHDCNTV